MIGPVAKGQFFTHFSLFTSRGTWGHNSNGNSIYANPPPHSTFRGVQMVCAEFGMVRLSDRSRQLIHYRTEGLFRLWAKGLSWFWSWGSGEILKLKFDQYFAADTWFILWSLILVKILKLGLVKILKFKFSQNADVWLKCEVDAWSRLWIEDENWSFV